MAKENDQLDLPKNTNVNKEKDKGTQPGLIQAKLENGMSYLIAPPAIRSEGSDEPTFVENDSIGMVLRKNGRLTGTKIG